MKSLFRLALRPRGEREIYRIVFINRLSRPMVMEDPYQMNMGYHGQMNQMSQSQMSHAANSMRLPPNRMAEPMNQYFPEEIDPRMQTMADLVTSEEAATAHQNRNRDRSQSNDHNDSRKSYGSSERDEKHHSKKHKSRRHRRSPSYSQYDTLFSCSYIWVVQARK